MATGTYKITTNTTPVYGESNASVLALQQSLNAKGANLTLDGKYGPLTQAAYTQYGTTTPTTTSAPVTTPPKTTSTSKNTRPILYNDPDEPKLIKAESVDSIQKRKLQQAQGVIGNLNTYYDSLVKEAKILGEGNLRKTNAISALTGLSGSTEANYSATKTEGETTKDINRVNQERQIKINEILSGIQTSAAEEAKQQRLEARQSEQDRIAYREKAQSKAVENLTLLSKTASGATLEGLKATLSEKEYASLISNVGGEAMASAILFENRPKDSILGTPQLIGGKMVQAFQTPDGKVKYESIDLPTGVTPDRIEQIIKDDSGIFIINKDGTYKRISGSGTPGSPTSTTPGAGLESFPPEIQTAAQSIYDGKSKLTDFPSKNRLQINAAANILYKQEGGNELAQRAYEAIETLETHPGMSHAVGTNVLLGLGKNVPGSASAGFLAELDTLKANIKLVNIKYLKGTGALSDAEGKTLEDAGTSLNTRLPEEQFKKELANVKAALLKANSIDKDQNSNISNDGTALVPGGGTGGQQPEQMELNGQILYLQPDGTYE